MSLGIGIGAFMNSLDRGMVARERFDDRREKRTNKEALQQIDTDTKAKFDAEVEAGTAKPDQYEKFWMEYALPQRRLALLQQGDVEGAKALTEWGRSSAALEGGKLFSSAMLKAQTGDAGGALADVIKAGQIEGYISHGYEFLGQDEIKGEDGTTLGYRIRMKDGNGKEIEQDIAVGDVPRIVSTIANPDAAWQSQLTTRAEKKKRDEELADYETKKSIDKKYDKDKDHAANYRKAREDRAANDFDFSDLPPEDQDATVRRDLDAADSYARDKDGGGIGLGTAPVAPPAPKKIIVDETTGQPIPTAAPVPGKPTAALGIVGEDPMLYGRRAIGLG